MSDGKITVVSKGVPYTADYSEGNNSIQIGDWKV
jgi:hypothetical protein